MFVLRLLSILFLFSCGSVSNTDSENSDDPVWSDEFEYTGAPDPEKWSYDLGDGCPRVCGWGNNEKQIYTRDPKNVRVENGMLIIEAHKENDAYSSARLVTKNKGDWHTGTIKVRAKLPQALGTWPAIWMLPTLENGRWPKDGEIDIMEHVGFNHGMIYGTIHTEKFNHTKGTQKIDSIQVADASDAFHEYILEWTEEEMIWKVDDTEYNRIKRNGEDHGGWPFDNSFHLILNMAVGGNWGGKHGIDSAAFPQQMVVDYVRVYK